MQHAPIVITDLQFLDLAEDVLQAVEQACDEFNEAAEVDIDNRRTGGMVTLVFPNASQIVINLQKPLHEIWLASRSGGYHYRFDGHRWMDTKGQGEFFAQLSQSASDQLGQSLIFRP